MSTELVVVMYHYVRNLPNTSFPRIRGMLTDDFRHQVNLIKKHYEMATLESALAFLQGCYVPQRNLCLLTFDDGLKEHYTDVLPILAEQRIQGLFFVITSCLEERRVIPVHKNHFLLAALDFDKYRQLFLETLAELSPETGTSINVMQAQRNYRWDKPEVATFKYLLNFCLPEALRDQILDTLFVEYLGDQVEFACQLYLSWREGERCRELR